MKKFRIYLGPTMDERVSTQRQLSSPSDTNGVSTASEQEVILISERIKSYECVL